MAYCIRNGGEPLASKEMAVHVLDVIEKIIQSSQRETVQMTETDFEQPAPFTNWETLLK